MKKSTKGAVAAAAAAVLLLGGAGTLAYWTATDDVDAGTLTAGNLSLDGLACGGWQFAAGDAEGTGPVTKIVPGDTVENTCTATITGEGNHLKATVEVDPDSVNDATLGNETVTITSALTAPAGAADGVAVPAAGVDVEFTLTAVFAYGTEDNDSQDQVADLGDLTVNAVQVHD